MDFDALGRLVIAGENVNNLPGHTVPLPTGAEQWPYTYGVSEWGELQPDGFVAVINSDRQILWSTYIGGSDYDASYSVRCGTDNIVVGVYAQSDGLPTLDPGGNAYYETGGSRTALLEFDLNGDLVWGTYTGHGLSLGLQGLAVDKENNDVVVVGVVGSGDLPVSVGAPWYDDTYAGNSDGGLMQFSGSDRSLIYATYISGNGPVEPSAVVVDKQGGVIIAGGTWDEELEIRSLPGLYTEETLLGTGFQAGDGFIMALTAEHWLAWSTYFGGAENHVGAHADRIRTLALDGTGDLYAAGYTDAANDQGEFFPLTDPGNGAWADQQLSPATDAFVAKFCTFGVLTSVAPLSAMNIELTVLPMPNGDRQIVGLADGWHNYVVLDAIGRRILEGRFQGPIGVVPTAGLATGTYVLQMDQEQAVRIHTLR